MNKIKWTSERLQEEALKYTSRGEFQKNSKTAYNLAQRRGYLEQICKHMYILDCSKENNPNFKWTYEMLKLEASKYYNKTDFRNNNYQAYSAAWRNGILNEICLHMIKNRNTKKTISEVCEILEKDGYKLLSTEYVDAHTKMETLCPVGHAYNTKLNGFLGGYRCGMCSDKGTSGPEKEIFNFIKALHSDAVNNDKKLVYPKEIDIYIPSISLAIEYCGLYWHNENSPEPRLRMYHINKMKQCNEKGIRLITIFEDEWLERQEQVKNFLLSVIGKNSIKIGARKTELREVPNKEAAIFLEENHIQGKSTLKIAFGLYHNEELIAIVTGNKHHRNGHENTFVLNRLAFKTNVSVSGGSSKLLKALIKYAKNNGYSKLVSWSDNRWSEGRVYEKLGFVLAESLGPDYSYVQKQSRISKQSCQKKNLVKKGAIGNTEHEMALSLGLHRIWDCGKKQWLIKL